MRAVRMLGLGLGMLAMAGGCSDDSTGHLADAGIDAPPQIAYERFSSVAWSLSATAGENQLSISDHAGAEACALASNQHNKLSTGGVQILIHLPMTSTERCPVDTNYELADCRGVAPGDAAYVTKGCAFYRKYDAQGNLVGTASALDGVITISGTESSCAIRATIGFVGASFSEIFTLSAGTGVEPWCRDN